MKTHILQLDVHDDVISVRDKMAWAKTPRLVLVLPRRGRILERTLDLRHLQRHAAGLGAQLALVTRSGEVRRTAQALGIPVFETLIAAQQSSWKEAGSRERPGRRRPRPDLRAMRREVFPAEAGWKTHPLLRVGLFILAVLAVMGLLLLFFPSATIELEPEKRSQSMVLSVNASLEITSVNLAGSLPAYKTYVVVEGSRTIKATGSAIFPDQPAQGSVLFRNLTTSVVGIPAGTVIRTVGSSPVRFVTTVDGVVAAGVGETVEVPVQALNPGTAGNLPAEALVAIEGELGTSLVTSNPDPTSGGTDQSAAVPTAGDRIRLHDILLEDLRQKASFQFQSLSPGDLIFPDTLTVAKVLSEVYLPAESQPGSLLTLSLRVQYQAQYANAADIRAFAAAVLDANLPAGFGPADDQITNVSLKEPLTGQDGITRWQLKSDRTLRARVDPELAAQMVQALKPDEAGRKLSNALHLALPPEIRISPSWWPWLPVTALRIVMVVR